MTTLGNENAPRQIYPLLSALSGHWWLVLLRGIAAIIFGVLAFVWPGASLLALVMLYGCYALADGVLALVAAISGGAPALRWWLALIGVLGIAAGAIAFLWPGQVALFLVLLIGAWSICHGILEIIGAIALRKQIDHEWMLLLAGALSVLFGIAVLAWPASGALALIWLIGSYALLFGVLLVGLAFRLKTHRATVGG
ncbi:HdeD family acid-resistance protein [Bosea lathyri]|uniref:Uncharacterized membrane protein HdeD, DUF308 family n=1 Tax=Bosea lathyri TaxID=1036778 RepID=A0A1H6CSX7_9HYPH|nr:HdeD family acid-resistance protein [Bosea lathyri]SEG75887.1 Uncharacterized membrane protein HdeD, DUF308 family [Bosea lathyri]